MAAIRAVISTFRKCRTARNSNSTQFLDEDLASVPLSDIPAEFRRLSRFLPMIVLVPKLAINDKAIHKEFGPNKSLIGLSDIETDASALDTAKAWFCNRGVSDTFEFGEITGCFSTMEVHRNGRSVNLTCKEFKTLQYLIKNPRRVVSRDELLNEVWGYQNYPCTRTVDNHILKLRQKLEINPTHPQHFHTVRSVGYKFIP